MTCNYCNWQGKYDKQRMVEHLVGCAECDRSGDINRTRQELFTSLLEQSACDASIEEIESTLKEQFDLIQQERFQHVQQMRGILQSKWLLFWQDFQTWRQTVRAKILQLRDAGRPDHAQQLASKFLHDNFDYENLDLLYKVPSGTERIRITGMRLDPVAAGREAIDQDVLAGGPADTLVARSGGPRGDDLERLRQEYESAISELSLQHTSTIERQQAEFQQILEATKEQHLKLISDLKAQHATALANTPTAREINKIQQRHQRQLASQQLRAGRASEKKLTKLREQQIKHCLQISSKHIAASKQASHEWTEEHLRSVEELRKQYQNSLMRSSAETAEVRELNTRITAEFETFRKTAESRLNLTTTAFRQTDRKLRALQDERCQFNVVLSRELEAQKLTCRAAETQIRRQCQHIETLEATVRAEREKAQELLQREMADARAEYAASIRAQAAAQAAEFQSELSEARADLRAQLERSGNIERGLSETHARVTADLALAQHENYSLRSQLMESRTELDRALAILRNDAARHTHGNVEYPDWTQRLYF